MGHYCQYCGNEVKWQDNRGWYREFCEDCAHRVADGEDLQASYDTDSGEPL